MVNNFLTTIWILVLAGAVIHFMNGLTAWRFRDKNGKRIELGVFMGVTSYLLSFAFFVFLFNSINYPRLDAPPLSKTLSIITWSLFAIAAYIKYMALTNGDNPGLVKGSVLRILKWFRIL